MVLRYKQQLGLAIARRRDELGMTQKQLAKKVPVEEPQTVSRWERGETMPSDLEAVATALDWTIAEMMGGIALPRPQARRLGLEPEKPEGDRLTRIEGTLEALRLQLAGHDREVLRRLDAILALPEEPRRRRRA